ncbi:hypothetical protein [Agrobacterium vitis]|nr:hypothetical protein [Agrobacterium vitis]
MAGTESGRRPFFFAATASSVGWPSVGFHGSASFAGEMPAASTTTEAAG